jgi:hypothetical protein
MPSTSIGLLDALLAVVIADHAPASIRASPQPHGSRSLPKCRSACSVWPQAFAPGIAFPAHQQTSGCGPYSAWRGILPG